MEIDDDRDDSKQSHYSQGLKRPSERPHEAEVWQDPPENKSAG
jgi:hypothetical protein